MLDRAEWQRNNNFACSMSALARRIQRNFTSGDLLLTLDFTGESSPVLPDTMRACIGRWIRCVRDIRRYEGQETRYLYAPGIGRDGPLYRVLVNYIGDEDTDVLRCTWHSGAVVVVRLAAGFRPGDVAALLLRETLEARRRNGLYSFRWNSSRFKLE